MLSLPIVLLANIFLSYEEFLTLNMPLLAGVVAAFVTGYLTIHIFMKVAEKVDFAKFVLGFALLVLLSLLI
jgi:undecaprenyl-diphosphatase